MLPAYLDPTRCDEISGQLSELLDGELDEASRRRVASHLAICGPCARLAAELAATVDALRRMRGRWEREEPD